MRRINHFGYKSRAWYIRRTGVSGAVFQYEHTCHIKYQHVGEEGSFGTENEAEYCVKYGNSLLNTVQADVIFQILWLDAHVYKVHLREQM